MNLREVAEMVATVAAAMKPNVIDRVVGYIDPERGARRLRARGALALAGNYYKGASRRSNSMKDFNPMAADADTELSYELPALRDRCRDLFRNEPIAAGAVKTICTNVIGAGLRVQSRVNAEMLNLTPDQASALENRLELVFSYFADTPECDIRRTMNFYDMQIMTFQSSFVDGDMFVGMPFIQRRGALYSTALQLIEGDRVSNKNFMPNTATLVDGVEKDYYGAPLNYWVTNKHPSNWRDIKGLSWNPVAVFGQDSGNRNILHIANHTRPEQTRGVPVLAPVIDSLKQLGRYTDAELMAAVISSYFTLAIETPSGEEVPSGIPGDPAMSDGNGAPGTGADVKLAPGAILNFAPGESVKPINPARPNAAFDPFTLAIQRQVGVGIELPYEILIKHFTASYSAARGAQLEAWRVFSVKRERHADSFCQPVYERVIDEAVALGYVNIPGYFKSREIRRAALGTRWIGPARGMIDEIREVDAARSRVEAGFTTWGRECAALGEDYEDNVRQQAKERSLAEKYGITFVTASSSNYQANPATKQPAADGGNQ